MNEEIAALKPELVWKIFANLIAIPRLSGNESAAREYLLNLAEDAGLRCKTDHYGNLMVEKPASLGWAGCRTVILQAHLDIVGQKNTGFEFDFARDPISATIRDGMVVADNTTLGADNGIGVALAMATMLSNDFNHCALRAIFTVEEEVGLHGASALPPEWVAYPHMLINLDSEELTKLYVGCAGGARTTFSMVPEWDNTPPGHFTMSATISGLVGGHSGAEIHLKRGNAIKLLAHFLAIAKVMDVKISSFDGGNADNAIPREATAVFAFPGDKRDELLKIADDYNAKIKDCESGATLTVKVEPAVKKTFTSGFQDRLLNAIINCVHGVTAMSDKIPGMTATSNNLAIIKTAPDIITIQASQRSENDADRLELTEQLTKHFETAGAIAEITGEYPGWEPNPDSGLVNLFQDAAKETLGHKLKVTAIHAGLECGIIGALNRNLDMVSVGPNLHGIHAPGESVEIDSVNQCWKMLKHVLANA